MIVDERLVTYINSLDRGNTKILDEIEREAIDTYVPIIRKEMQSFLRLLLTMQKPMRILEVGTAVGFSAILMAEYGPKDCQIVTIENYEKRIPIAKDNFVRKHRSHCWKGMQRIYFHSLRSPLILFLWMQPKASTFIFCQRYFAS